MIIMKSFKKLFTVIFLYFIFFNANSYSEIVKKVEVKGNARISQETIMVFGDAKDMLVKLLSDLKEL